TPCTADPLGPSVAEGHILLIGLSPEHPVTVNVSRSEQSEVTRPFGSSVRGTAKPGEPELVVTVPTGETFTFPIVTDETDGPPDGATVMLSVPQGYGGAEPPPTGKVVGRDLRIDRVTKDCINILARADDCTAAVGRI